MQNQSEKVSTSSIYKYLLTLLSKQLFLKYVLKRRPKNVQLEPIKIYAHGSLLLIHKRCFFRTFSINF